MSPIYLFQVSAFSDKLHYETVTETPGVDSHQVARAVLQVVAKMLAEPPCVIPTTQELAEREAEASKPVKPTKPKRARRKGRSAEETPTA